MQKKVTPLLGFTCLDYLWYVSNKPDGPPVCVMRTKENYCLAYVSICDLLMAANGGPVSFAMDIAAATKAFIPVIPVDILAMLGSQVPAFKYMADGSRIVNDAVSVLLYTYRLINIETHYGGAADRYARLTASYSEAVVAVAREKVPVAYAYNRGR